MAANSPRSRSSRAAVNTACRALSLRGRPRERVIAPYKPAIQKVYQIILTKRTVSFILGGAETVCFPILKGKGNGAWPDQYQAAVAHCRSISSIVSLPVRGTRHHSTRDRTAEVQSRGRSVRGAWGSTMRASRRGILSIHFYSDVFGIEKIPIYNFGLSVQCLRFSSLQLHMFERKDAHAPTLLPKLAGWLWRGSLPLEGRGYRLRPNGRRGASIVQRDGRRDGGPPRQATRWIRRGCDRRRGEGGVPPGDSLVRQRRQMTGPRRGGVEAGLLVKSMSKDT